MSGYKNLTQNKALKVGTYIGEFATPGMGPMLKLLPQTIILAFTE